MCGILLHYSDLKSADERRFSSKMALRRLTHRGPDRQAIWDGERVSIGHARLSIIDLDNSVQPMTCPEGRYVIAFNGEIYNYKEIKRNLADKWRFKTEGDTEVLLAGLILEGVEFLSSLSGMWSFLLWDEEKQELLVSRDRFGKKPLYFYDRSEELFLSSELPSLKMLLESTNLVEDSEALISYFKHGFFLPGQTVYQNVNELKPGHYGVWKPGSKLCQKPYWTLDTEPFNGTYEQAQEKLKDLLVNAIELRLVADVEVGAFLSGGIDSSLITSIMVNKIGVIPKTFNIGFGDSRYDESQYATQVARHLNTKHFAQRVDGLEPDLLEDLIIDNVGQPFADPSLLPTAIVSKLAAQHVKVALSGDGADEVFSGYQRYQAMLIFKWYFLTPKPLRKLLSSIISALPASQSHHSRSLVKKAQLFFDLASRHENTRNYGPPSICDDQDLMLIAPKLNLESIGSGSLSFNHHSQDDIYEMMVNDIHNYMPQDILLKVDRASMASSLEVRSPFLDNRLVEFSLSLPRAWHRKGTKGKRMLRDTFGADLPKNIWRRRKQGFSVPLSEWMATNVGDRLSNLLDDSASSSIDANHVHKMLAQHRHRREDYSFVLWAIYVYLSWRKRQR